MDYDKLERDLSREDLQLASISKRVKAFVVDELLILAIVMIAFWDKLAQTSSVIEFAEAITSLFMVIILLKIIYQGVFTYLYGATLGKIWQRIIIINIEDFHRPNFTICFVRAVGRVFSEWFLYIGFAMAYLNPAQQSLHDKLGKTIVIDV